MKYISGLWFLVLVFCGSAIPVTGIAAEDTENACIRCHQKISPGQVEDWRASRHSKEDVGCDTCHGEKHME